MTLLSLRNIWLGFGGKSLFEGLELDIYENETVAIIGRNGRGKTTLARMIAGEIFPERGSIVNYRKEIRISCLPQTTLDKIEVTGAEEYLSGGEVIKKAIVELLKGHPGIAILDEPTNHMDSEGIEWLIREVCHFKGTTIIISHDRYFLDRVVGRTIEIKDKKAISYNGNYTFYMNEKRRVFEDSVHRYKEEKKEQKKIQEEIDNLREWSEKSHRLSTKRALENGRQMGGKEFYRVKAKKLDKRVESKISRLEKKLENGIERPREDRKVVFNPSGTGSHGKRMLEARCISKSYGDASLFINSCFSVTAGERIALIGRNGCGKTTLLKIISGEDTLDRGELWVSPSVRIAYMPQTDPFEDSLQSALDFLLERGLKIKDASRITAYLGLVWDDLKRPIKSLSPGERTKIRLTEALTGDYNLVMLDEPTNHLDSESREAVEKVLQEYGGTLLVVSHDRYFIDKVCNKKIVFDEKDKTLKSI